LNQPYQPENCRQQQGKADTYEIGSTAEKNPRHHEELDISRTDGFYRKECEKENERKE